VIEVRHDSKRGCGWRKPGGLYLVCAGEGMSCGKLPVPLDRCPTCAAGIKPARGWTWVNGHLLLSQKECLAPHHYCARCPANAERSMVTMERCGLLWIGEAFYATPADWIDEASKLGVSRRIPAVPKDFVLGTHWVMVAHRKGMTRPCESCVGQPADFKCPRCDGKGLAYLPAIFHLFKPSAIEYVVKGTETKETLANLRERGITPVKVIRQGVLDFPKEEPNGRT